MSAPIEVREILSALRDRLNGRAAGAWRVVGDRLELLAFDPSPELPRAVAEGFATATRSVELARVELAVARAAATGQPVESIADELPPDAGSGFWLRALGASRSVAVPIVGASGAVEFVASVALGLEPDADAVASLIRAGWRPIPGLDVARAARDNRRG